MDSLLVIVRMEAYKESSSQLALKPLSKILYLQLDNTVKDNKNKFVMAFCSLLTSRRVFKEVAVGFLTVGHTHEDIDGCFSYLSRRLWKNNIYDFADLMKSFMDLQSLAFIPEFVQEVGDFKEFIKGYHHKGTNALVGLGEMQLFKFYVQDDGWPVMKYKKRCTN